jgi:hypothetical protein
MGLEGVAGAAYQASDSWKWHRWLDRLPDFSEPYRKSSKISHRAWFSPEEYKQLYTATRQRAKEPEKKGFNWESEQLHDFVLFRQYRTAARRGMAPPV